MDTKLAREQFRDEATVELQHCPSCQMPIEILKIQTFAWHLTECMAVDRSKQEECSKGVHCDSTIVNHYLQETHEGLANYRSGYRNDADETLELPQKRIKLENSSNSYKMTTNIAPPTKVAKATPTAFDAQQKLSRISSKRQSQPRITSYFSSSEGNKYKNEKYQRKITSFFNGNGCTSIREDSDPLPLRRQEVRTSKIEQVMVQRSPTMFCTQNDTNSYSNRSMVLKKDFKKEPEYESKSRKCPFYKKIPDTSFVVDAFSYGEIPGVSSYFLSHFHYDHYNGLKKNFKQHLYVSRVTANLVKLKIGINDKFVHSLPLNESCVIKGVEVELIEANHCPGAVMFVFRLADGRVFLHTGDFRAHPDMENHPTLKSLQVDILYLDTTYCNPKYTFPSQQEVLDAAVEEVKNHIIAKYKTLIVCGSYTIGKEKVFCAIAESLQLKVWADREKWKILECLEDEKLESMLTENSHAAGIHILSMGQLHFDFLQEYLRRFNGRYDSLIALKPTGWEYHGKQRQFGDAKSLIQFNRRNNITILGVPYSEHSSYEEMQNFVKFLKPTRIIATVNVTGAAVQRQNEILNEWLGKSKQFPISYHFRKINTDQ